jgi:hypothetical protein
MKKEERRKKWLDANRPSHGRTKALAHLFHTPARRTVIRPAVRCQATKKNEIQLEVVKGKLNQCIHLAH